MFIYYYYYSRIFIEICLVIYIFYASYFRGHFVREAGQISCKVVCKNYSLGSGVFSVLFSFVRVERRLF